MNLLIVFAFAGDSTMTRFLAIAERPTFHADAGIPRARMMRARTRGAGLIEARTIAPRRQEGEKAGTAGGADRPRLGHHFFVDGQNATACGAYGDESSRRNRGRAWGNQRGGPCPLILLLRRLRRRRLCTFSSCCRASCRRCPGSR